MKYLLKSVKEEMLVTIQSFHTYVPIPQVVDSEELFPKEGPLRTVLLSKPGPSVSYPLSGTSKPPLLKL